MAPFKEFAEQVRELIPTIESNLYIEGDVLGRLNLTLRHGTELVKREGLSSSAGQVREYRDALGDLSACLRRCESRLLDRRLLVANQLRHLRNVNQWTRSSADTL